MNLLYPARNALRDGVRRSVRRLGSRIRLSLARMFCPVCEQKVVSFAPLPIWYFEQWQEHGYEPLSEHDETLNIAAYSCPHCGAPDRDRLYAIFLRERLPTACDTARSFSLVDFAPSRPLAAHIRRKYAIHYRTADLLMPDVDDRVDLRRMDIYQDSAFDAFICSHVLEHIPEDVEAMRELYRILKPGGWGIAMVPIPYGSSTMREDFTKTMESERWKLFGQGDHVRIYSRKVFIDRLQRAGFRVRALDSAHFGTGRLRRHGLSTTSTLYVVEKQSARSCAAS